MRDDVVVLLRNGQLELRYFDLNSILLEGLQTSGKLGQKALHANARETRELNTSVV